MKLPPSSLQRSALAITLLVTSATFVAPVGHAAGEAETRTLVQVDGATRQAVLREMRLFLDVVQGVLDAAVVQDMGAAAAAARKVGLTQLAQGGGGRAVYSVGGTAPVQFRQLGAATHAGFDRIAQVAQGGGDSRAVLVALNENMRNCVACHAGFRFPAIEAAKTFELPSTVLNPPHGKN